MQRVGKYILEKGIRNQYYIRLKAVSEPEGLKADQGALERPGLKFW